MLALLLSLLYGPDLARLSSPDYREREAGQRRLEAAGWWAAPALWHGMRADSPERVERCERAWVGLLARQSLPAMVCRCIDATGRFDKDRDSWRWCQLRPYLTGSLEGDLRYAAEIAARGAPQRMPATAPDR